MAGHIHAKLMAEYAKDAATHEKPWELWEIEYRTGSKCFVPATSSLLWHTDRDYRRKSGLSLYGAKEGDIWLIDGERLLFTGVVQNAGVDCMRLSDDWAASFEWGCDEFAIKGQLIFRAGVVNKL